MPYLCPIILRKLSKFITFGRTLGLTLAVFCFLSLPTLSLAGSFMVAPVKIDLTQGEKLTVVKITNNNDENVTIQLYAKKWAQDETGSDSYEDTEDIVFFPKIATIEKGEERLIRIGFQGKNSSSVEKTYRLFFEELPVSKPGEVVLRFALKVAIPIFISPVKEIEKPSIEKIEISNGKIAVKVKNGGNKHFIVENITVLGSDSQGREVFNTGTKGWYVLAGSVVTYEIDLLEVECYKADKVKVSVEAQGATMGKDLVLNNSWCTSGKEGDREPGGKTNR